MLLRRHPCNENQRVDWVRLGEALEELREAADINKAALAARMGVSKSTITRMEEAKHKPTIESLERYVVKCGSRLSELFLRVETGIAPAKRPPHGQEIRTDLAAHSAHPALPDPKEIQDLVRLTSQLAVAVAYVRDAASAGFPILQPVPKKPRRRR